MFSPKCELGFAKDNSWYAWTFRYSVYVCLAAMDQELVKDQLDEICPDCSIRVIQRVQLSVLRAIHVKEEICVGKLKRDFKAFAREVVATLTNLQTS